MSRDTRIWKLQQRARKTVILPKSRTTELPTYQYRFLTEYSKL